MQCALARLLGASFTVLFMTVALAQPPPSDFSIQWDTNKSSVRVVGVIPRALRNLDSEQLREVFPVAVEPPNVLAAIGLPPMLGNYAAGADSISFQPRYPFEPGVSYRATFTPGKLTSVLRIPLPKLAPSTVLMAIYPSADVLPQNLLKFYLHFSAPMSRGEIYQYIHLVEEGRGPVELPFLEIDEELWNPEMTRLTLFLDPGRIKRGVRPLEEVGPALVPEKSYTLSIDANWRDARGIPLKNPFAKKFRVTPPDRDPPDPTMWKITAPAANTLEALVISFPEPMDHALALRMISVQAVQGKKTLERDDTIWRFKPDEPWKPGRHEISILSTIEDLAGNNIGKPFEVDLEEGGRPRDRAKVTLLYFEVK